MKARICTLKNTILQRVSKLTLTRLPGSEISSGNREEVAPLNISMKRLAGNPLHKLHITLADIKLMTDT
jgi:hypothetical protein